MTFAVGISMRKLDVWGDSCMGKVLRQTEKDKGKRRKAKDRNKTQISVSTFHCLNRYLCYLSSFPLLVLQNL